MEQKHGSQHLADKKKASNAETSPATSWRVDANHVYPVNDFREHSITNCWCQPIDDEGVIVHNSLDGREQFERGERKAS